MLILSWCPLILNITSFISETLCLSKNAPDYISFKFDFNKKRISKHIVNQKNVSKNKYK